MIQNHQNNEHHNVCARRHYPCSPQARWGPGRPQGASTTKAEGATEGGAADRTGDSVTVSIVWQKKNHKKVLLERKLQREHKRLQESWGAGSELASAAGVALQEAHDGRVALGPSDELFQGQFSISVGVHLAEDLLCPFLWS